MRTLLGFAFVLGASMISACGGCGVIVGLGGDDPPGGPLPAGDPVGEGEGEGEDGPAFTLVIEPTGAVLEATVGGSETLQLEAFLVDPSGARTLAPQAFWASLNLAVGDVDQAGVFTPSRERAGECLVRARAAGVEGTAIVRVHLHEVVSTGGASAPGDFTGEVGPTPAALLYPEDGVVIPANLAPMVIQWDKIHARARVIFSGPFGSLELYGDGNQVQATQTQWRSFLLAHVGSSFTLTLEETDGPGLVRAVRTITVHLAAADLTSTVYYWAVDRGQIVRIDADSLEPIDMPIPAQSGSDNGCRACHSLSANGQRMSFTYFGGDQPGGVIDTNGTSVIMDGASLLWNFSALNPDGSLMVTAYESRLTFRDGNTGAAVPGYEDLGVQASHPTFSPTGTQIAFPNNILQNGAVPDWEIDFTTSDIAVADVDPAARTITGVRTLVPGGGRTLYQPSFSPDGRLVAYADGTASRSTTPADLMLASASDTSGDAPRVKLVRANPGSSAYAPTFNPKIEGGYMWVAFFSRRDYGHHLRSANRPQVWIAAVDADADPAAAVDPSHPGFWLPGQSEGSENLSSFFAPKPCAETGGLCDSDAGCCGDGLCRPVDGVAQCVPPAEACALTDDACQNDGDCCDGLNCTADPATGASTCLPPGSVCSQGGQICQLDADCCEDAGLCVDDGAGTTRCLEVCGEVGKPCSDNRPCCDGTLCNEGTCLFVGG
jgi:hypothetical protein